MKRDRYFASALSALFFIAAGCSNPGEVVATLSPSSTPPPTPTPHFSPTPWSSQQIEVESFYDTRLQVFIKEVEDGTDLIRGVYIKDLFALWVIQQPEDNPMFVTPYGGMVSQFKLADEQFGSIGLLGHPRLAGADFFKIPEGQEVVIVYGNGNTMIYKVSEILKFQAYEPNNPYSDFIQVDDNHEIIAGTFISADNLYRRIYFSDGRLVFQTCIDGNGNNPGQETWGRLFVIAEPVLKEDIRF